MIRIALGLTGTLVLITTVNAADIYRGAGERRVLLNAGMVNGSGFQFLPAAKYAIFCVFTCKNAIQKVRCVP